MRAGLLTSILPVVSFLSSFAFPRDLTAQESGRTDRIRLVAQLGQRFRMEAVAFSADGRLALTGNQDGTALLWDVETGRELQRLEGELDEMRGVALSPDGRYALTGGFDEHARLWDVATGRELRRFEGHEGNVTSVAFSPDGRTALTGSVDHTARIWDVETGQELQRLERHTASVLSVAFSPNGRFVLTAGSDSTARLWDPATGFERRRFEGHEGGVTSVIFSPNGRTALTGSRDGTARQWDLRSGRDIRRLGGGAGRMEAVAFSPDGRYALSGGSDDLVHLWDLETGSEVRRFEGHLDAVEAVAVSPDGRHLLTASRDGSARLWDLETGSELRRLEGQADPVSSVTFSPDGRYALAGSWGPLSVRPGGVAHLWDRAAGRAIGRLEGHAHLVVSVAVSPDGRYALTGSWDGTARLWDVEAGRELRRLEGHGDQVLSVDFSPDGRYALSGGADNTARIWDTETGLELRRLEGHGGDVQSVTFSPDGRYALTGSGDGTARLWELETGLEIRRFEGHTHEVTSVAFSADGRYALSGGADNTARIWDTETGLELRRLEGQGGFVTSVAFSPDGRRAVTGHQDGITRLWDLETDLETGRELHSLEGHGGVVLSVAFSPDGAEVLTGSFDGTVRLWDASSGSPVATLISFRDGTWAVVDPDGRYDASDGGDVAGLHWVVDLEPIALSQLKERYYEPGLLAKILGFNEEALRPVDAFDAVALHPQVETEWDGTALRARLVNRGGGIGRVGVWLNGKQVTADARDPGADPNAETLTLTLDLTGHPYLIAGAENEVEVRAFNAGEYLSSRGTKSRSRARGEQGPPPELWAVVAGVSDYAGDELDLRYAEKDAVDIASALELGAANLFGAERVHLRLLTTADGVEGAEAPTKANLVMALEQIGERASATDLLVVYLAGHGVTHGGPEGDFYYLTQEASSGSLEDPAVRESRAVSTAELTELIADVAALKQVLILDTCGSGRVVEQMTESRDVSSSQKRALERLKDRMGTYVLAGSAADAVSYEASRYGQGLLTYSLLLGMRGAALREERFVDVGRWFDHAVDQVPELARGIGGIQQPQLATPRGSQSFDVAQLEPEDRVSIRLADPKPFVVRATFQDQDRVVDHLGLTRRVNEALRAVSTRGPDAPLVFVDAPDLPGALTLGGLYRVEGADVTVTAVLSTGSREPILFTLQGDTSDLQALVEGLIIQIEEQIAN